MVFPSKEARDRVVRDFGAVEGGKQTLERAAEYTAGLQTKPFVISREFAAPRDLVWRVWTEPEHFSQWFGPKGFKIKLARFDLQPGGMTHYSMVMPEGKVLWGRAVYREIAAPAKLVWLNSFSDEAGGIAPHPLTKDPWPLQMLTTIVFTEQAGKTTVTIHWVPFDSTAAERATFEAGRGSMAMGWTGTLDQLTAYLSLNP
ncbi:SRPBCC domain-containing protein [Oleiharenicola lentus]|uniref:SRPBCC domain-containing protein n=2 Tax=Oleiharenicola lentus TaxID=2508720 RepID=A0A4Q1CD88_9BACT|nr:SRPBCC domain-containing protein [Oleiharenicola lentus]